MPSKSFARYAWAVLAFNVVVVLWGAVVRATVSGAGCGQHWPRCNGELIPTLQSTRTLIEFSHRVTSGIALLMVVWLAVRAWKMRGERPHLWRMSLASLLLMVAEALIGAGLVLLRLVELDASVKRAVSMSLHLTNTFFLLSALTVTAMIASFEIRPRWHGRARTLVLAGGALLLLTGISGALAALGDTLFPATSLAHGLEQDTAASSHFLLRLRWLHPFVAVVAASLFLLGSTEAAARATDPRFVRWCRAFTGAVLLQVVIGVINLLLLVPLWSQILHLLGADALVISFAGMAALALSSRERQEVSAPGLVASAE